YYSYYQTDAYLNENDITIEHLLGDNGDTENAHIHNLALANGTVNSDKLRNKPVNEKILILNDYSNLHVNHRLPNYLSEDGKFISEERKENMASQLFYEVFKFQPDFFGWSKNDLSQYLLKLTKIKELNVTSEKMKLDKIKLEKALRDKGKHFDVVIKNDPTYEHLKEIYSIVFEDTLFLIEI
ncbi:hypothetical protein, partial [Bacillus sp. MM2020_4]